MWIEQNWLRFWNYWSAKLCHRKEQYEDVLSFFHDNDVKDVYYFVWKSRRRKNLCFTLFSKYSWKKLTRYELSSGHILWQHHWFFQNVCQWRLDSFQQPQSFESLSFKRFRSSSSTSLVKLSNSKIKRIFDVGRQKCHVHHSWNQFICNNQHQQK